MTSQRTPPPHPGPVSFRGVAHRLVDLQGELARADYEVEGAVRTRLRRGKRYRLVCRPCGVAREVERTRRLPVALKHAPPCLLGYDRVRTSPSAMTYAEVPADDHGPRPSDLRSVGPPEPLAERAGDYRTRWPPPMPSAQGPRLPRSGRTLSWSDRERVVAHGPSQRPVALRGGRVPPAAGDRGARSSYVAARLRARAVSGLTSLTLAKPHAPGRAHVRRSRRSRSARARRGVRSPRRSPRDVPRRPRVGIVCACIDRRLRGDPDQLVHPQSLRATRRPSPVQAGYAFHDYPL